MPEEHKCNCLEKIKKTLMSSHGSDSEVELELKMSLNMNTFETRMDLPPLYYRYKLGKKRKKSFVAFNFCPFCGIKI